MKILYVASEVAPFFRTGGLAEVAGSLPEALARLGAEVRVVMPLYLEVGQEFRSRMKQVASFTVPLSWRNQYCGVFELEHEGVTHYFIDNEFYFKRPFAYGQFDDAERFAYFSKAVLEMLPHIGFMPDVIHCNDWQTGLIPVYLRLLGRQDKRYRDIRTVFTIHNLEYQGRYGREVLGDVFGIPGDMAGLLEFDGGLNIVKGAIEASDSITTVSPTYGREILAEEHSNGLARVLQENSRKLAGILNGIDTDSYDPATDKSIFANYSADDCEKKAENKKHLQKMLGLAEDPGVPVLGLISRLVDHKGIGLVSSSIEELMCESLQFVVLGTGDWKYEQMFVDSQHKYPGKVSTQITFSNDLSRKIYAAADLFLMPSRSEPCGLAQIIALRYGAIPVVRETGGLADTISNVSEDGLEGNGFVFKSFSGNDMLCAVRRALGFYEDRAFWPKLVRRAMECDFSWEKPARAYMDIFEALALR